MRRRIRCVACGPTQPAPPHSAPPTPASEKLSADVVDDGGDAGGDVRPQRQRESCSAEGVGEAERTGAGVFGKAIGGLGA